MKEKKAMLTTPESIQAEQQVEKVNELTPNRLKIFMSSKFPDKQFADDNEFNDGLADYVENANQRLSDYEAADETIRQVATAHPELMDIVEDLSTDRSMSFAEAVARNLDPEEIYPKEGDPDFEAMRKAHEMRLAKKSEATAYQKKIEANLEESKSIVQAYFKSHEMSDAEANSLAEYIDGFMDEYLTGRISASALDMFRNAMNYSSDIQAAREEGSITAKNAKIDAVRQQKQTATDGLPGQGGSAGGLPPETPVRHRVFDTAKILGMSEDDLKKMREKNNY
ncbi:MAG: hypothetical protein RR330_05470 [Alistipes sp.]